MLAINKSCYDTKWMWEEEFGPLDHWGVAFIYLFIYVTIKEHFCRDCLWKFFAWFQRVSVTQRVPVLKSVIFVEGVFVAQGYVDFSVTAVSLATTLSLSVKVRLQVTCMSSDRPLSRQALMLLRYCFYRGWSHVHWTRWALGEQTLLFLTVKTSYIFILQALIPCMFLQ